MILLWMWFLLFSFFLRVLIFDCICESIKCKVWFFFFRVIILVFVDWLGLVGVLSLVGVFFCGVVVGVIWGGVCVIVFIFGVVIGVGCGGVIGFIGVLGVWFNFVWWDVMMLIVFWVLLWLICVSDGICRVLFGIRVWIFWFLNVWGLSW